MLLFEYLCFHLLHLTIVYIKKYLTKTRFLHGTKVVLNKSFFIINNCLCNGSKYMKYMINVSIKKKTKEEVKKKEKEEKARRRRRFCYNHIKIIIFMLYPHHVILYTLSVNLCFIFMHMLHILSIHFVL